MSLGYVCSLYTPALDSLTNHTHNYHRTLDMRYKIPWVAQVLARKLVENYILSGMRHWESDLLRGWIKRLHNMIRTYLKFVASPLCSRNLHTLLRLIQNSFIVLTSTTRHNQVKWNEKCIFLTSNAKFFFTLMFCCLPNCCISFNVSLRKISLVSMRRNAVMLTKL
jgi:hypothetical protein